MHSPSQVTSGMSSTGLQFVHGHMRKSPERYGAFTGISLFWGLEKN